MESNISLSSAEETEKKKTATDVDSFNKRSLSLSRQ
jgi:hypothetical protein